jgi:two-component system chemotaxis response regulator CheB
MASAQRELDDGVQDSGVRDPGEAPAEEPRDEPIRSSQPTVRIVAFAASAGGITALREVLSTLPPDLPAPVLVVQHLAPHHRSHMAQIMSRHTDLLVRQARDGEVLRPGVVYIAPPDRHLLVNPAGTVTLAETEMVHFLRPSADLLFESAAAAFGAGVIAVVLSGTGEDGAMGVRAVKKRGGTVIVQDTRTAEFAGMPLAALRTGLADQVLPLDQIGEAVTALLRGREP